MNEQNPLLRYYRQIKSYVALPSGTTYYDDSVIKFTDSGEVGIRAMTSADEMVLKNPDALLNGEAIKQIIDSCVDGIMKPEALLTNDIDMLLVAIRGVSYGANTSITASCPKCQHEDSYNVDIDEMIARAGKLEEAYPVNLNSGATVFVKPFTYSDTVKATHKTFEQSKVARAIENPDISDEEKLKMFSSSFKELAKLNYDLLSSSVVKIVDETNDVDFANTAKNRNMVREFIKNIDVLEATKIDDTVKEINSIGIDKSAKIKCTKCDHIWQTEIDLNPVNFFTES